MRQMQPVLLTQSVSRTGGRFFVHNIKFCNSAAYKSIYKLSAFQDTSDFLLRVLVLIFFSGLSGYLKLAMAEYTMVKRTEDDCDMVTSIQEPFLSKEELKFHEAARSNRRDEVEKLVKKVKLDCRNSLDRTALHMAASKGNIEIVDFLIKNGAAPDLADKYGMTALMWATYFGHYNVVVFLIDRSANIKRRNKLGMHALHIAADKNHARLVELFVNITKRTVLDDTEKNGHSAVMIAAAKGHLEIVELLTTVCNADLYLHDLRKRSVLHLAAESGNDAVLRALLSFGRQKMQDLINEKDDSERMPIHYAVEKGFIELVASLLEFGANPNVTAGPDTEEIELKDSVPVKKKLMSPFHLAAVHGHTGILKMLAAAGAEVQAGNSAGFTALHFAALNDRASEIYTLVHMGCSVLAVNNRLQTPLHLAAEQNKVEAAEALLLSGAPLNLTDKTGKTPLILATRGGCVTIVDMIIKAERLRAKVQRLTDAKSAALNGSPGADKLDAEAFRPDGYENRIDINPVEDVEELLTETFVQEKGQVPAIRLREFNQPYAEEFKQFLWKLAFKHLRHNEWKKLAIYWRLRLDHIQAIEQQHLDENSYKQQGYRVLCIWFHGIGLETPIRELYSALVHIDRRSLAVKVRQKLDRSAEYFEAGRRHSEGKHGCALQ